MRMHKLCITIPEEQYTYIKDIATASSRSVSNQISCLIKECMEGDEAWQVENGGDQKAQ